MSPKTEKRNKKAKNISKWYDEYVYEHFSKLDNYGHTKERHCNIPDTILKERLLKTSLSFASSFNGISDDKLAHLFQNALIKYRNEVIMFLADDDDEDLYPLLCEGTEVLGHLYSKNHSHEWNKGAILFTDFVMMIGKRRDGGFIVPTVFLIMEGFWNF
ncbi:MAG: hypothetical protein LUE14_07920 [Clostridiales bacterium]|nr:hypothetical protein [Clostridiales bacterium]